MCAGGYPEAYQKGTEINLEATKNLPENLAGTKILHAGTAIKNGKLTANGGRVLNIVSSAQSFKDARYKAYAVVDLIDWKEGFCRKDIGQKVI